MTPSSSNNATDNSIWLGCIARPGNTPACAGKGDDERPDPTTTREHPRVRGEGMYRAHQPAGPEGTPPRARGRATGAIAPDPSVGTPPRARGRAVGTPLRVTVIGNTPACAGKGPTEAGAECGGWEHPRVRGEGFAAPAGAKYRRGTPPRARGRGSPAPEGTRLPGNTPACAGKGQRWPGWPARAREHPRVRGEGQTTINGILYGLGTPPRARGRVTRSSLSACGRGNTPACAGKGESARHRQGRNWEHPRVRGEGFTTTPLRHTATGTPPRARGRVTLARGAKFAQGNTPACAGKGR